MIDAKNNRLKDGSWNKIKSYWNYIWDDIYAAQVWRWLIDWARPVSGYWEITTTWVVTNQIIHPIAIWTWISVPAETWVQMTLVSSSAQDDKDWWTWIQSMEIHYLDVNLESQIEIIELEWATPVTTDATDMRFIQCMHLKTFWTWKAAAWNISAKNWATTYSYVEAWARRCSSSARRVPKGKRLLIKALYWGSSSWTAAASVTVRLVATAIEDVDLTEDAITFPHAAVSAQDGSISLVLDMPLSFPEWVIIAMECTWYKWATINGGYVWYFENA